MTRRIIAFIVLCLLLPIWPVFADKPRNGISYVFSFYGDNGHNLVIAPSVLLSKKLTDTWYLGANAGVDAITSATKQAAAAPPPSSGDDDEGEGENFTYRVPVSLYLTYDKDDDTVTGGGYYSYETTYIGRSVFAAYTRRLNLNNTALGIAFSQSFDYWVPDRPLPTDDRSEKVLDLSFTQLLSPRTSVQFIYSSLWSDGFLAQPTDNLVTAGSVTIYAQYPEHRKGSAYAVRLITLLNDPTSLHLMYRYYRDDWHIQSDTVNIEVYRDISPSVVLGCRYRYYGQTSSFFAKDLNTYTPADPLVAVNYRMYAFHSNAAGAMAIIKPSPGFLSSFDPDKLKVKLSADLFSTSSQPNIQYQYKTDRLTGLFTTIAVDFDF